MKHKRCFPQINLHNYFLVLNVEGFVTVKIKMEKKQLKTLDQFQSVNLFSVDSALIS